MLKKHIYLILNKKKKNIVIKKPSIKYTIYNFLIKKKYKLYTGEKKFKHLINNILILNKPFKFFIITKKPKSYPFKLLKS